MKKSIHFCSFGGANRFCESWWCDLGWYVIGLSWTPVYNRDAQPWWRTLHWRRPGWLSDILTYWHRARYGWAPKDTWSLDYYLNGVLAGALLHLAETANGCPAGYGREGADKYEDSDFEKWDADLRRWALAFSEDPNDVEIYDKPEYVLHRAEEERRRENIRRALQEIEPWWEALWN